MHITDAYQLATKVANQAVADRYHTEEWVIESEAHQFWLSVFDVVFARLLKVEAKD